MTLEYANPRTFYTGSYQFRSWNAVLGTVLCLVFGAMFAWGIFKLSSMGSLPLPFQFSRAVLVGLTVLSIAGAGYYTWGLAARWEILVRISEDGIERGRRFWPWRNIKWIGGQLVAGGISLECHVSQPNAPIAWWPVSLQTTPLLTRGESRCADEGSQRVSDA